MATFHTIRGPPNVYHGDLCSVLARLQDQRVCGHLLEDVMLMTPQDHRHLGVEGLVHLELLGQEAVLLNELVGHGHQHIDLLALEGLLPGAGAGVYEGPHVGAVGRREDGLVRHAQPHKDHLLVSHLHYIVLRQALQLLVHAVGVDQLTFEQWQPRLQLRLVHVKLMVAQACVVHLRKVQGLHHGGPSIQRGVEAGGEEVAVQM
mmetsp:Transcript_129020/g.306088  ORF Transcript_129020/g.306088 Transcript_129020/m.306088 type:complete len:204 (+) Transcript_129020:1083-1694(+)